MKIATPDLLHVSEDSSASFIPSWDEENMQVGWETNVKAATVLMSVWRTTTHTVLLWFKAAEGLQNVKHPSI